MFAFLIGVFVLLANMLVSTNNIIQSFFRVDAQANALRIP
jgi:hypothetical protein